MANTNINFDDFVMRSQAQVFQRVNPAPLDKYSVFSSLAEAEEYASSNPVAYAGQLVAVVTGSDVKVYVINDGKLDTIGGGAIQVSTYSDALAAAKADNIGSIIYVSTEETIGNTVYTAGAYIVTGEGVVAKLGTTTASGDIAGDVEKLKGDVVAAATAAENAKKAADAAQAAADAAQSTADTNTEAIATLNGTGEGSVKKTVDDTIATLDLENTYASKSVVDTLVGSDSGKSVRSIAVDEVAKVVANAPADFDTLKEIADWIENDTTGSAQMANDIKEVKDALGTAPVAEVKYTAEEAAAYNEAHKDDPDFAEVHEGDVKIPGSPGSGLAKDVAGTKSNIQAIYDILGSSGSSGSSTSVIDRLDSVESIVGTAPADGSPGSGLAKDVSDLKGTVANNGTAIANLESATSNTGETTQTGADSKDYVSVSVTTKNGGVTAVNTAVVVATVDDINALFSTSSSDPGTNVDNPEGGN